jgi:transposase
MARGDLTDDEWALVEPYLPPLGERGPIPDLRRQFNAVIWRFRTGSPWRDVPVEYGSWSTIYDRFHSWALQGVFAHLMEQMIALAALRGQVDLELVSVDSTMPHGHHHAAGMRLDPELLAELEKAAAEEKGVRERHKRRITRRVTPPRTRPAPNAAGDDAATGPD